MASKADDGRKWIYSFTAICALIAAYCSISFLDQMSEWFDLEAKVSNFIIVTQFVGIAVGLVTFVFITKHTKSATHMSEVYGELIKVIWPDKDTVVKLTIGIIIGCLIASGAFLLIDIIFRKLLEFVY